MSQFRDLAAETIELARRAGATGAECTISEGEEFSVNVRLGEIETLKQAGSRSAGLRILIACRTGSSYTSDLTPAGIRKLVDSAIELAAITTEDPHAGLPDPVELGALSGDLSMRSLDLDALSSDDRIDLAKRAEAASLTYDPRVTNTDGASFDSYIGRNVFTNSLGFMGEYETTYCSIACSPIAKSGDDMERDYWYSSSRGASRLESPELIGSKAAARAVRRLGAVKLDTQKLPVIFEPRVARSFAGTLMEAVDGRSIYRQSSFLLDKVGERVASPLVSLIDDGTIPGAFGTHPFDDEGVKTRRTTVIAGGVLKSYLLNSYAARKLGLKTTGNASRGITGNAGIGHGNLFIEAGPRTPEDLIRQLPRGLYVTELMGSGVNVTTGDYSRGAAGILIENGELTHAVSEVTIAGTLQDMLMSLEPASDLEFRGSVAAPTLYMGEMTVGGA